MTDLPPLVRYAQAVQADRDAFDAWEKTRAICLTLDPATIDEQVVRYMREAWQAAIKHARAELKAAYNSGYVDATEAFAPEVVRSRSPSTPVQGDTQIL